MATLSDVARRAGVSPATASRVINGSSKPVTDELRERVLAAVAELQYVPNAHAQLLARSHRSAVGVIVHDVSDPYFAEITRGLQRVATDQGRLLMICNSYRDPDRELEYVELLRGHQVAALILAGSGYHDEAFTRQLNEKLAAYEATGGRVAVIGRHEHSGDAVMPDNRTGGYLAGRELCGLGHRAIGVVAGPRILTTTTDRLAGLRQALAEQGRELPERRIRYAEFDRDGGAEATARAARRRPGADRDRGAQRLDGHRRARHPARARVGRAAADLRGGFRRHADRPGRDPGADHRATAPGRHGCAGDVPGARRRGPDAPGRGAPRRAGPPRHRRSRPTVHPRHRGFRATRTAR